MPREILQSCPSLPFTYRHPPFKPKLLLSSPKFLSFVHACLWMAHRPPPCSGAEAGVVTAGHTQPRPRGRGPYREQQRGGRKPGPTSGGATEASGGAGRGLGRPAWPPPRSLTGRDPGLALAAVASSASVWGRPRVHPESYTLSAYPNPLILQIRKLRPRDQRGRV